LKSNEKEKMTKRRRIQKKILDQIAMVEATQVTATVMKTKTKKKKLKN
jgi:hypothetical protein